MITSSKPRRLADVGADAARQLVGTKFVHQQSLPGVGMDCGGVLRHVLRTVGDPLPDEEHLAYPRRPPVGFCRQLLVTKCVEIDEVLRGAFLIIRTGDREEHLAVAIGDGSMVHAVWRRGVRVDQIEDWELAGVFWPLCYGDSGVRARRGGDH